MFRVPMIYQGICKHCDHKTVAQLGAYGAVLVDTPASEQQDAPAAATSPGPALSIANDPRFVVLRHPLEDRDLARTGYTWREVCWQGRHVGITNVICRKCGTLYERRRLLAPINQGCLVSLSVGLLFAIGAGLWWHSVLAAAIAWWVTSTICQMLFDLAARLYVRRRFGARARWLAADRACPHCHVDDAQSVSSLRRVICPSCSTKSLRFIPVAIT